MRYLTIGIIAILYCFSAQSQTYEIGVYAGGANYIGDVGKTNYINPTSPVFGGIVKWNRSPRHSFRFSLLAGNIEGKDTESKENRRNLRGYEFESKLIEASLGLEYTFWEFDMHEGGRPATPYLYSGLTYFNHDEFALDPNIDELVNTGSAWNMAIPMVIGFKAAVAEHFVLAIEMGARYTFTDNLDGSVPSTEEYGNVSFGNINNNDWYMFSGLTLTYTFGRRPCYCGF